MKRTVTFLLTLALTGCINSPTFLYGEELGNQQFEVYSDQVGIHPDRSVLDDPNNPFSAMYYDIGAEPNRDELEGDEDWTRQLGTKWLIEAEAGDVMAFYHWATLLARRPTGEHQYYTALNLRDIYENSLVESADLLRVRDLSIAAFSSVLENFPEDVTYDNTGTIFYELATLSYNAIIELGGSVPEGWILIETATGTEKAVKL